jgi:hypothetical protein
MRARLSSFLESGAELLAAEAGLLESGAALLDTGSRRASRSAAPWSWSAPGRRRRRGRRGSGRFVLPSRRPVARQLPFGVQPDWSAWRPAVAWAALVGLPSIASRHSRASIASYRSTGSIASVWSVGSVLSAASFLSAGSMLSIGSAGSVLSIGSSGSILSIGSSGSILSCGSAGSVAGMGAAGRPEVAAPGPDPAVVRRIGGLLAVAAIVAAPFGRPAA